MDKIRLEQKILEFPIEGNSSKELFVLKSFPELTSALNIIKKDFHLKFFYCNREIIKNILYEADTNIKIVKECVNDDYLLSFYYLSYIINDDIYNINYTYDIDIINELYSRMLNEKEELKRFILYILAFPIIYNYEGFNEPHTSIEEDKLKIIYKNIGEYMRRQQPVLDEFDLNLDLTNYETLNIDYIYSEIIISLIRKNNKFDSFK